MRRHWLPALLLTLLVTACATATSASAPTLEGTQWVVTQVKGADTQADSQPTMGFAGGLVSGLATCNRYSAGFSQSGAALTIAQPATTLMACTDAKLTAQEAAFVEALGQVKQVRGSSEHAELLNEGGTVVLTLAPKPEASAKPLVGTGWTLSGIVTGGGTSSPVAGSTVSLSFTDDALSGRACNTFRAAVTIRDAALTVDPIAATSKACADVNEGKQETTVLGILGQVTGYAIDGDTLTLSTPESKALVFTAS
ncbi:META domain-containing protein [Micropruina sp.]|uniref:META domain-containing protein n=1 Tax=Micropruina sp. TaxID=2737536 RepID=UPI0039E6FF23